MGSHTGGRMNYYSQQANPDATNSEMDSKTITPFIHLTNDQRYKLIQQFVELQVDNMDVKTMAEWITDEMVYNFETNFNDAELKEEVDNFDEELYGTLVEDILITDLMKEENK